MKKTERVRQVVSGPLGVADLKQQTEKGWKLVAIEWEREVDATEDQLPADVPFGLQMAPETQRLEENPVEREMLFLLMELIVQEGSCARIADEINRRGFRTRQGAEWSPVVGLRNATAADRSWPARVSKPGVQKRRRHLSEGAR